MARLEPKNVFNMGHVCLTGIASSDRMDGVALMAEMVGPAGHRPAVVA